MARSVVFLRAIMFYGILSRIKENFYADFYILLMRSLITCEENKINHKMRRIVVFLEGRLHEKDGKHGIFSTVWTDIDLSIWPLMRLCWFKPFYSHLGGRTKIWNNFHMAQNCLICQDYGRVWKIHNITKLAVSWQTVP